MTPKEWSTWERLNGSENIEEQWFACPEINSLLHRAIELGMSERKMRLFGCACCRMNWQHLREPAYKRAVEAGEQFAIGKITQEEMYAFAEDAVALIPEKPPKKTIRRLTEDYMAYLASVSAVDVARVEDDDGWPFWERLVDNIFNTLLIASDQQGGLGEEAMQAILCDRLRDIVGNPFRPVLVPPVWRTKTVLALAKSIQEERSFDRLTFLADILEKEGCTHAEMLNHCREQREHVLGCWVIDTFLGQS